VELRVTSLHTYPIKGVRAINLDEAIVEARGLQGDRRWMIVDGDGLFRSQRTLPSMACIRAELWPNGITLAAPNMPSLAVEIAPDSPRISATVWRSEVPSIDAGDGAAEWLTELLGETSRLVHMPVDSERLCEGEDLVSFADGYPILLALTDSLDDLNERMSEPVPMTRFRPNIVVTGGDPWTEDQWEILTIGEVTLENMRPCGRCSVTTVDQDSGQSTGVEPLRTLSTFRKVESKVNFGVNLIPRQLGRIQVGDLVTIGCR
jgi:uncharacterized protein YcbX